MSYSPSAELKAELLKHYNTDITELCLSKLSNEMRLDNGGFLMFERPRITNQTDLAREKTRLTDTIELLERERVSFYRIFEKGVNIYSWVFDPPAVPEAYEMEQLIKCSDSELTRLKAVYAEELQKLTSK